VPAVSLSTGGTEVFTNLEETHLAASVLEIALATSAAPFYFPIATIGAGQYADGGLAANTPDLIALQRARQIFGVSPAQISCLSVGTTSRLVGRAPFSNNDRGIMTWASNLYLIDLIMSCQQELVDAAMKTELGERYLRVNPPVSHDQSKILGLDNASREATVLLKELARHSAADTLKTQFMALALAHSGQVCSA